VAAESAVRQPRVCAACVTAGSSDSSTVIAARLLARIDALANTA
jgi:hypothetical protein